MWHHGRYSRVDQTISHLLNFRAPSKIQFLLLLKHRTCSTSVSSQHAFQKPYLHLGSHRSTEGPPRQPLVWQPLPTHGYADLSFVAMIGLFVFAIGCLIVFCARRSTRPTLTRLSHEHASFEFTRDRGEYRANDDGDIGHAIQQTGQQYRQMQWKQRAIGQTGDRW